VGEAVQNVAMDLWDWSKNILGDLEKRIKRARRTLEESKKKVINGQNVAHEAIFSYKLERLEYQTIRETYIGAEECVLTGFRNWIKTPSFFIRMHMEGKELIA
jgi:hypothetical protein